MARDAHYEASLQLTDNFEGAFMKKLDTKAGKLNLSVQRLRELSPEEAQSASGGVYLNTSNKCVQVSGSGNPGSVTSAIISIVSSVQYG